VKCELCGYEFYETRSKEGCEGCPMSAWCRKNPCPNCGYENPGEPALLRFLKKLRNNDEA
jgi:hypothetical protein